MQINKIQNTYAFKGEIPMIQILTRAQENPSVTLHNTAHSSVDTSYDSRDEIYLVEDDNVTPTDTILYGDSKEIQKAYDALLKDKALDEAIRKISQDVNNNNPINLIDTYQRYQDIGNHVMGEGEIKTNGSKLEILA